MIILLDADSTIINTHQAILDLYRNSTGDYSTKIDDDSPWDVSSICPKWDRRKVRDIFKCPQLFKIMQSVDGAVETTKKLQEEGHRLVIVTIHRGEGITYKSNMLKRLFPHINEVVFIDNGNIKMDKSLIKGDLIIDDHPNNITSSPCKAKILFGQYQWNKDVNANSVNNCIRAYDWVDIYNVVGFIDKNKELFKIGI